MTPMNELRKGLDERGVRHMDFTRCGTGMSCPKYEPDRTHWSAHGGAFKFTSREVDGILYVKTSGSNKWVEMTPEQAIAATVGAGTCHDADVGGYFVCSECEALVKLHSIGRSYVDGYGKRWYATSNNHSLNFCPNCGRRIEVNE